jgi:hypothetical protein
MRLTEFQKGIVKTIAAGDTCHIETFFETYCERTSISMPSGASRHFRDRGVAAARGNTAYISNDRDEAYRRLKEFILVWQKLEEARLIFTIPYHKTWLYPIFFKDGSHCRIDGRLLALFYAYDEKEIVPTPDLDQFLANGCRTTDEIEREEEKKYLSEETRDRKTSQALTKTIAIISIVASFVATGATILFNYLTYTTNRSVTITNPNAFRDTSRVLLIAPSTAPTDTAKGKKG